MVFCDFKGQLKLTRYSSGNKNEIFVLAVLLQTDEMTENLRVQAEG